MCVATEERSDEGALRLKVRKGGKGLSWSVSERYARPYLILKDISGWLNHPDVVADRIRLFLGLTRARLGFSRVIAPKSLKRRSASLKMMAKRTGKARKKQPLAVVRFEVDLALLAVDDETVLQAVGPVFTHDFFCISADIGVAVRGLTSGEGNPMEYGVAHGDYSVSEIAENLDSNLTGPAFDMIVLERTRRKVRRGGYLKSYESGQTELNQNMDLKRIACRFQISEGKAFAVWLKNKSGATLTTGAVSEWIVTLYGRWV